MGCCGIEGPCDVVVYKDNVYDACVQTLTQNRKNRWLFVQFINIGLWILAPLDLTSLRWGHDQGIWIYVVR